MNYITKRIISAVLALLLLITPAHAERVTERKSVEDEAWLWDALSQHSPSDVVTAAVLSYFWRESQYRSDAVAGWGNSLAGYGIDLCETVTEKTDAGLSDGSSRDWFIKKARRHGGYGLGQWYRASYVEDLYDFAREWGTSIGDAEMQCAFVFHSLERKEDIWKRLKRCKDPEKAGRLVAIYYDGTRTGVEYIGYKAGRLYDKYHEEESHE